MKKLVTSTAILLVSMALAEIPTITGVTAQQRYPWNGKVDISYTVIGDIAAEAKTMASVALLKVIAIDSMVNTTNVAAQLSGDTSLLSGTHNIVWDMDAEGLSFKSSNVVFKVMCEVLPPTYYVIDLSAGPDASSYPVEYLAEPPSGGFNVDEYKTTKLVLRRIEPGSFVNEANTITLTKPFYIGVFEMTQKQYELISGANPSSKKSDKHPVERVSYNGIRGSTDWPSSSAVGPSSFMGILRAHTGLAFDLPTEAQWEYACRAGTTSKYNNGGDSTDDLKMLGRYRGTGSSHTEVGSYLPNAWGLYDMHGNVEEWCLDWDGVSFSGNDPVGPASSVYGYRITRGGSWNGTASDCTSSYRCCGNPSVNYDWNGFRIALPSTSANEMSTILCSGTSEVQKIDIDSGTHVTRSVETIHFSTDWVDDAPYGAVAVVEVNGNVLNSAIGTGFVDWTPSQGGIYTLTHKVIFGSEQIGETLAATFLVESPIDTPVFSPANDMTFINASQEVSITCDTSNAMILYTTDGSDPVENGIEYKGPFEVYESCTVRAIARKLPLYDSEETSVTLTRAEGLSEAANLYGYLMETDGSYPWTVVTDVSHDGVSCVRSGSIGNGGTTHLLASVRKAGTVSFWWKAACEDADVEDGETYYYDYGVFLVDDVEKAWIAGHDTGWRKVVVDVPSGGKHVLRWEYRKDGATSYAPDCVWIDQVQWIPADGGGYTLTTPEPVPYAWLSGYGLGLDSDFETAAKGATGKRGGDGRALQVWQDYVAGTDPTNAASVFTAGIEIVGGVPQVTWSPNLNTNGIERSYTIWGKTNLTDGADWECPTNAAHRFFKVTVEMP